MGGARGKGGAQGAGRGVGARVVGCGGSVIPPGGVQGRRGSVAPWWDLGPPAPEAPGVPTAVLPTPQAGGARTAAQSSPFPTTRPLATSRTRTFRMS